ncbi:uncharacterized protein LOC131934840 [Physella acuta]|uniref:uncharacterized protein LOC131934840 n=1 Tax=Physella acuta TaxID=109671 RepID=UPI0027DAF610|nr:uncharacterized protein LOC131934840 [Physella acuta]
MSLVGRWPLTVIVFIVFLTSCFHPCTQDENNDSPQHQAVDPNDPHGGVQMGSSNNCDDGKTNLNIDWDPSSTEEYTCTENIREPSNKGLHYSEYEEQPQQPRHICYPNKIEYTEDLPTSGPHRPVWPKYGEYKYIPVQRWLHSLEHGAVVFFYHPCADPDQILAFKYIAKGCLWKHIITPYKKLPPNMNFAILTWRNKLVLSDPDVEYMVPFIRQHALQAPEGPVSKNGEYEAGLIQKAQRVSDEKDSDICPQMLLMQEGLETIKKHSEFRQMQDEMSQIKLKKIMDNIMTNW